MDITLILRYVTELVALLIDYYDFLFSHEMMKSIMHPLKQYTIFL